MLLTTLPRQIRPIFRAPNPKLRLRQFTTQQHLPSNPHIYIHPSRSRSRSHLNESYTLSLLPKNAPTSQTAIGHSTTNPPTPSTFTANPSFLRILHATLAEYAHLDPGIQAQAVAFAATAKGALAAAGGLVRGNTNTARQQQQQQRQQQQRQEEEGKEVPLAEKPPVGFMHVADERNPPAYGRIPEPEDIFGSLEVSADGGFVDGTGGYQQSGTYRILTREGCLGLSDFLRWKLVKRLQEVEKREEEMECI